ncbi:putative AMMECR1 domain-containing protein [Dioscorea sansibarensis]
MVAANQEMAVYCFDTLVAHYTGEEAPPPAFDEGEHPLFVTWKKAVNGGEPRLRGCIGTLEARDIITGFRDYALTSALRDRRFPPIQAKEIPYLECTVSVLADYESGLHYLDWEVGKHGLIIEFTDPDYNARRSATYLPEVAAHEGWTKMEAIDSLMRKAGYNGLITESLRKRVRLTRYQSTLYTMHYGEYVAFVKNTRGAAPAIAGAPKPHH